MKNEKSKIAYLLYALIMACLPMFWPQNMSKAQYVVSYKEDSANQKIDSINAEKNKTIDSALRIASTLPQMSITLNKVIKSRSPVVKTQILKPEVLIRFGGEIFEASPEEYKGYLIIDYDKFIAQMEPDSIVNEFIEMSDTLESKPPKRSWLYRLFHNK